MKNQMNFFLASGVTYLRNKHPLLLVQSIIFFSVKAKTPIHIRPIKFTMQCCLGLLAAKAPRPKARQVAFQIVHSNGHSEDEQQHGVRVISVYVCKHDTRTELGFPHFVPRRVFFGKLLHVQWTVDLKETGRHQETSHGFVAWQWQRSCLTSSQTPYWLLCVPALFYFLQSILRYFVLLGPKLKSTDTHLCH